MSLDARVEGTPVSGCQGIDDLIQHSKDDVYISLGWITNSTVSNIESLQTIIGQKFSYARHEKDEAILLLLENNDKCTPAFVKEFARIYSLPTYKYDNKPIHIEFRRYAKWHYFRNRMIKGFIEYNDNYYLVAERRFLHWYSRYGFCSACGILRYSPVWCICGHKELSNVWTSNNKKLDDFIKKSQIQTNSANDAYLEWIPFDCLEIVGEWACLFNELPTYAHFKLIPLDIENETGSLYKVIFNYIYEYVIIMYICCCSILYIIPNSYAMIIQIF
jgi:hypothetical protein